MTSTSTVLMIKPNTPAPSTVNRAMVPNFPACDFLARSQTIKPIQPISAVRNTSMAICEKTASFMIFRTQSGLLFIPQENPVVLVGLVFAEIVAIKVKTLEVVRIGNTIEDGIAAHQAAGLLGVETDHFVLTVLPILELGGNQPSFKVFLLQAFEIFVRGQVDQYFVVALQQAVYFLSEAVAPERIQILAAFVLKLCPHFQPVWLHQVERFENAI